MLGVTLPGVLCGQPLGAQLRGVQGMQTTDVQSLYGELLSVQFLGGQLLGALDVQAIDEKPLGVQCVYRSVCSCWACGQCICWAGHCPACCLVCWSSEKE